MKIEELLIEPRPLLEGRQLDVYNLLLPLLLIQEEDAPPDVTTPPDGGWHRPGPFRPGGGMNGNHWFNQLYSTLKNLMIATNISKRLKELGIKGEGAKRVKLAQKIAAKHVKLLLMNPGATAYRIPVWTTAKPPRPVIKMWNEAFATEFARQLSLLEVITDDPLAGPAWEIEYEIYGTNKEVPLDKKKRTIVAKTEADAKKAFQKLIGGRIVSIKKKRG